MTSDLAHDHELLRRTVRSFAESELEPRAAAADESERLPAENFAGLARLGLVGMALPEAYGGGGLDMLVSTIVIEEIARACRTRSSFVPSSRSRSSERSCAASWRRRRRRSG